MSTSGIYQPRVAKLFSRKKSSGAGKQSKIIVVSIEAVLELLHLRQHVAAQRLGISLTAFKSACKKIGVYHWPNSEQDRLVMLEQEGRLDLADCNKDPKEATTRQHEQQILSSEGKRDDASKSGSMWPEESEREVYHTPSLFEEALMHVQSSEENMGCRTVKPGTWVNHND